MTNPNGRISTTPTPYAVICPRHGRVYLTTPEYERQMIAADSLWKCPDCYALSEWDDENYEARMNTGDDA